MRSKLYIGKMIDVEKLDVSEYLDEFKEKAKA